MTAYFSKPEQGSAPFGQTAKTESIHSLEHDKVVVSEGLMANAQSTASTRLNPYDGSLTGVDSSIAMSAHISVTPPEKGLGIQLQYSLPSFQSSAAGRIDPSQDPSIVRRRVALRDAFVPSQPVTSTAFFVGRTKQLERLIRAVEEERSHVVLYGKRGLGKTSLINIFAQIAQQSGYIVLLDAPGAHASFSSLFRSFLSQISLRFSRTITLSSTTAEAEKYFDSLLPAGDFGPRELSDVLSLLTKTRIIFFIDEYDRVASELFRSQLAELLKNLSDRGARVSLVILGVAENLDHLLGYHPSIRRNVVGVPITRMSPAEVGDILKLGAVPALLTYAANVERAIVRAVAGSPYYTRLLALYSCRNAIESHMSVVNSGHLKLASKQLCNEFSAEFQELYAELLVHDDAVGSSRAVLAAAAHAFATEDDEFTLETIAAHYQRTNKKTVEPNVLENQLGCLLKGESAVLKQVIRNGQTRYTFTNQDFAFYVILKNLS